MKNAITIILVSVLASFSANKAMAQELNVIGSSGTYSEDTGGSIAWTLGEVVSVSAIYPNHEVTQGFHQPMLSVAEVIEYTPLDVMVYPNPARDIINIETSLNSKMSIYDIQGKMIDFIDITSNTTQIDVSYLIRGTYTLVFEANGTLAKKMKIVIL